MTKIIAPLGKSQSWTWWKVRAHEEREAANTRVNAADASNSGYRASNAALIEKTNELADQLEGMTRQRDAAVQASDDREAKRSATAKELLQLQGRTHGYCLEHLDSERKLNIDIREANQRADRLDEEARNARHDLKKATKDLARALGYIDRFLDETGSKRRKPHDPYDPHQRSWPMVQPEINIYGPDLSDD